VDKQEGRKGWTITREDMKIAVEQVAVRLAGGYWCTASERLTNLFQVLNWEKLRGMGMVERTEHVKKMAGERFADFREEGFNFE
jgi:DNA polymerase IIIc chi subunit